MPNQICSCIDLLIFFLLFLVFFFKKEFIQIGVWDWKVTLHAGIWRFHRPFFMCMYHFFFVSLVGFQSDVVSFWIFHGWVIYNLNFSNHFFFLSQSVCECLFHFIFIFHFCLSHFHRVACKYQVFDWKRSKCFYWLFFFPKFVSKWWWWWAWSNTNFFR